MADADAKFYFRFRIGWCPSLQMVDIYQQTKFRSYSSIHSWVLTISGLEKQMSANLEFFFRLLRRPYYSNRRAIPLEATKFRLNRSICGGVITSYTIWKWRQRWLNTNSRFVFDDVSLTEGQNLSANQISLTYLNPQLIYNHFRFGKTNVRHIRILFPFAISTRSQ